MFETSRPSVDSESWPEDPGEGLVTIVAVVVDIVGATVSIAPLPTVA